MHFFENKLCRTNNCINFTPMSNRLNQEREQELQPKRIEYDIKRVSDLGYEVFYEDSTKFQFLFKGRKVTVFPYSGWCSGGYNRL